MNDRVRTAIQQLLLAPSLRHSARLDDHLTNSIEEMKGNRPMPELPANAIAARNDALVPSLTGALTLADSMMQRIARAKARHDAAEGKVAKAFDKLDGASEALESLASKAEAEADAVLSKLGQVSNS